MNKTHLTAIKRKRLPLPMRWLKKKHLIIGDFLDYGCGRCHQINQDCIMILKSDDSYNVIGKYVVDGYDPYYRPDGITLEKYDTIVCNFVLNVIESIEERYQIIWNIQKRLKPEGKAYLSVRNDISKLKGKTKRGTWQGYVALIYPLLYANKGYALYDITPIKKCFNCGSTENVERRRRMTAYVNDELNFITCCEKCMEDDNEYWEDRWKECCGSYRVIL